MKILRLKINLASIITIALLVFCNLFVFNVTSKLINYPEEGLFYDDFVNQTSVDNTSCVYNASGHYFYLAQGIPVYNYSYDTTPTNIGVWKTNWSFLSKDTIAGDLSRFLSPDSISASLQKEINQSEKSEKLSAADNKTIITKSAFLIDPDIYNICQYPVHRFHIKIDQDVSNIEKLTIKWWFGDYITGGLFSNLKEISMYIWTHGTIIPSWTTFSDLNIIYSNTTIGREDGEPDIDYTGDERYISDDGYLDFLLIGTPIDEENKFALLTDYINISVETKIGYLTSGSLISDNMTIGDNDRWESIIWDSKSFSNKSSVTISVLEGGTSLKEIKGYSETLSPLDISGISNKKIRIKATLHSKDPLSTPYVFSWGVLYQKESEWKDSFSNDYRVKETLGTKIQNGTIIVSNYSGEWPFFGKNSDNTRFYQGPKIYSSDANLYWYTEDDDIAGGFRSPVVSDGKIYVASNDKKIYAYNLLKDLEEDTPKYVYVSDELLTVESSLGVYEDYLIAATGESGINNKIYALNKNNLSDQLWVYSYSTDDETICYSSNPTIDGDRLYITSWGGKLWDTPYFSSISSLFGGNNKIIVIDIKSGNEIWEPVTLPTGSISSPAVGNGFVYVGCQNMYGPSLFAFDSETGDEIWNTSLGIIGRSSPVYADEKVFVLSNKKQNISSPGTYMLTAVNANNGKTIWNMSLGEFKTSSLTNILKGLKFLYKILEGYAPISTPAYKDGTLFVLSPNGTFLAIDTNNKGTIKWKYNISSPLLDLSYYVTSPVVVGDMVYMVSCKKVFSGSELYAFNTEYSADAVVTPVWSMEVSIPPEAHLQKKKTPDILASPIISDNIIILSATDNTHNLKGSLICIGDYIQNYEGTVKSTNIYLPPSKWWNKFNASFTNGTKNKVIFKILDEDDTPLTDWFNLSNKGKGYDLSKLSTNVIKLCAKFNNTNKTQIKATLQSWMVNWTDEKSKPVFDQTSFKPGIDGWINSDLTNCSIQVEDKADNKGIKSGLDIDSAKYKIGYIEKNTENKKVSDWLQATSSNSSGIYKTRIVANFEEHGLNVKKYVNITFTIKDLAGNQANSTLITFKTDTTKPESNISNFEDFKSSYNTHVIVQASVKNTGAAGSISDIDYVSLIYQYSKNESAGSWSDWRYYGDNLTPTIYTWEFGEDLESGYYKILTIAHDKAGNIEDKNESKIVDFFFDDTDPVITNKFESIYNFTKIPSFSLKLYDDFSLDSLYYRLDNDVNYIKVVFNKTQDINEKQEATVEWTLPDEEWADFTVGQEHYIYFKLKDSAGNEYNTTKSNTPKVIKDENISQIYVDLTDFSTLKLGNTYTVKANIPSDINVSNAMLFYQYSDDNSTWSEAIQVGDDITLAPFEWSFKASNGSGYYKFYTKIIDTSGAQYTSDPEIINVKLMPNITLVLIAIAIIFILLTIFIIRKMKKR